MAVSPIDGRYRRQVEDLSLYFSEYALIKYRVRVEIEYFIALCELPLEQLKGFAKEDFEKLRDIYRNFSAEDAQKVKDIEKVTNHDVKAVEYFIKDRFIGSLYVSVNGFCKVAFNRKFSGPFFKLFTYG